MMARARSSRWLWLVAVVLAADRAIKYAIERTSDGFRRELVPGLAWLVHSTNPGIAFGFFASATDRWIAILLIAASSCVVFLLVWLLATGHAGAEPAQIGLALIAGGAAGNLLDRMMRGGVTDFLELHAGRFEWPAFNLADSAITIGALLVLYEVLRSGREQSGESA
jgi:signal peptidase II